MTHTDPIENYTVPPTLGVPPLSQEEAGYVDHGPFTCANCSWFQPSQSGGDVGSCRPIGGPVRSGACCDFWNDRSAPQGAGKIGCEYVYVYGSTYTCAECAYFDSVFRNKCWPVEGPISPGGSCNKWSP